MNNASLAVGSNLKRSARPPARGGYDPRAFGQTVRMHRLAQGIGLRGLAHQVRMSPEFLTQIERGQVVPEDKCVATLARKLDCPAAAPPRYRKLPIVPVSWDTEGDAAAVVVDACANSVNMTDLPVPVERIVERGLGLALAFENMRESGCWFYLPLKSFINPQSREIVIDTSLDPRRGPEVLLQYRFVLAHQIGHWHLHAQVRYELFGCHQAAYNEQEADLFASCLLMPEGRVRDEYERQRAAGAPVTVASMAQRFQVTDDAMRARLHRLGITGIA